MTKGAGLVRSTLRTFWEKHADTEEPLKAWHAEAEKANWTGPRDVKARYQSASFLGKDRVVFNISGNKYRLIVAIHDERKLLFARFVGTHAEYDGVDAETI